MARHPINLAEGFLRTNPGDLFAANGALRGWRPHSGSDWSPNKAGSQIPVYAMEAGTVIQVNNWSTSNSGPGRFVTVAQKSGWFMYAHLSSVAVNVGQSVREGQQLGRMGTTGFSTGVHLHVTRFRTRAAALANAQMPVMNSGESVSAWSVRAGVNDPTAILSSGGGGSTTPPKGKKVRILKNHKPNRRVVAGDAVRIPLDKNGHGTLRNDLDKNRVVTDAKIASITANFNITAKAGNKYRIYGQRLSWDAKKKLWVPRVGVGTKDFVIPKNGTISDQFTLNTYIPDGQRILYRIKLLSGKGAGTVNSVYIHGWME